MATFKREIKKLPSEQNLRLLSSLVISLANKTSSVEDKCISPWKAGETYQKDVSFVVYNRYIYSCMVTNNDDTFTESHWTKLADSFDELSVDDVKAFLNLTPEQVQTLSSIILDTEVRLDKTYSSSKIYTDIQDALKESKEYCLKQLASKSTGSFKKVNDTTEVTDGNYLYLILNPSTSKYDIYALVDSNVELLTSVDVNLDDYYTKTEVDNDFLKKTDADGKYATITTVDGKVDKTSIATAISSTPSVDKVASEKAVYDKNTINHKTIKDIDILDYASKVVDNFEFVRGFNVINSPYGDSDSPNNDMLYMINRITVSGYCRLIAYDLRSTFAYMRTQLNGTWTDWVRLTMAGGTEDYQTIATPQIKDGAYMSNSILCGTDRDFIVFDINKPDKTVRRLQFDTVEKAIGMYDLDYDTDTITEVGTLRFQKTSYIPPTNIAPADETTYVNFKGNPKCNYCVKNGVCYVSLFSIKITSTGKITTGVFLPKCLNGMAGTFLTGSGDVTPHVYVHVIPNTGELAFDVKDSNVNVFGSFSYPVAED